jgi:integrase
VSVPGATVYYLRYTEAGKRRVVSVGVNLDQAVVAFLNAEQNFARTRAGLVSAHAAKSEGASDRVRIEDAVARWFLDLDAEVETGGKSRATQRAYKGAVLKFQAQCGIEFVDEITAEVLKAHKLWLFRNIKKRVRGSVINTVCNHFRYLCVFLGRQGVQMMRARHSRVGDRGLLEASEMPREEKKAVDKFSEAEVNSMLAAASLDESDLVHVFLKTGCRAGEVQHLKWSDVDWKKRQIVISDKPEYDWRLKDREARTIPADDEFLKRLAERRRRFPESDLLFPNTIDQPDRHLISRLQRIVKKAKATGAVFEGAVTLHRFRRTFASMLISHCDLQTVSALLGHADLKTTSRYLAPDQERARAGVRTAFKGIGN